MQTPLSSQPAFGPPDDLTLERKWPHSPSTRRRPKHPNPRCSGRPAILNWLGSPVRTTCDEVLVAGACVVNLPERFYEALTWHRIEAETVSLYNLERGRARCGGAKLCNRFYFLGTKRHFRVRQRAEFSPAVCQCRARDEAEWNIHPEFTSVLFAILRHQKSGSFPRNLFGGNRNGRQGG